MWVLGFAATAGVLGSVFATNRAAQLKAMERNYSNPSKFIEPKFANLSDMETVCMLI